MKPLLRGDETVLHDCLHGIRRRFEHERELLLFRGAEVAKHEVRRVLPTWRAADSDPHAHELVCAEGRDYVAQSVVAAVAAAELEPHCLERQIEFVVDDDEPLGWQLEVLEQVRDRAAGSIHVAVSPGKHELVRSELYLGDHGVRLVALELRRESRAEFGDDVLPRVVSIRDVAGTGVTEPDYQPRFAGQDPDYSAGASAGASSAAASAAGAASPSAASAASPSGSVLTAAGTITLTSRRSGSSIRVAPSGSSTSFA